MGGRSIAPLLVVPLLVILGGACSRSARIHASVPHSRPVPVAGRLDGDQPLIEAAAAGDLATVKARLAKGAPIDGTDGSGRTPLIYAAMGNRVAVARYLIERGAHANLQAAEFKETALIGAVRCQNLELARLFLDKGASPNGVAQGYGVDVVTETALMAAIRLRNPRLIQLLMAYDVDVNERGEEGRAALATALKAGDVETARRLIERGADVNTLDDMRATPLMYAAGDRSGTFVQLLLDRGADVKAKDAGGRTALEYAASANNGTVTRLLTDRGASVPTRLDGDTTALIQAAIQDHGDAVRLLARRGVNLNAAPGDWARWWKSFDGQGRRSS